MNKPVISIVTCVYNGLPFLKECVESVLMQNYQHWELLISDDGSSDGSREYLDSLTDERIIVFKQTQNRGIFGNLNFLLEKASASVAQILCQDDYLTTAGSLQAIVDAWSLASQTTGFIRFNHSSIKDSQLEGFQKVIVPETIKIQDADLWFYIFGNIPGNLSNVSLRLNTFRECGGFDQALPYAGDFDFWSRAARKFQMSVKSDNLIYIRRHAGAASNHLNKKGELIEQKRVILSSLYKNLLNQYPNARRLLKTHGTYSFILQYDTAIRRRLKGKRDYWDAVTRVYKESDYVLREPMMWIMFLITAGGRFGRVRSAKKLLSLIKHD